MKIVAKRVYVGPNIYANFRVIALTIQLGTLEEHPSAEIPGFVDKLVDAVPSLGDHGCSYGEEGGFIRRMKEDRGTWMGHILEHLAIELQNLAGANVSFGKTRSTGTLGEYTVVYEYENDWVGVNAGQLALDLLHHLIPNVLCDGDNQDELDIERRIEWLIRKAERKAFGPSTGSLVKAAEKRDIPWIRINESSSLVQFGHGKHQQRIWATTTSQTSNIGVDIAKDKELTNQILESTGLPVPKQYDVYHPNDAVRAAARIGYPVVVKPYNGNHGRAVSIGLTTPEEVRAAVEKAKLVSKCVLVESFIPGFDHRMLVIDGDLVAVAKRVPGHVVGDGQHTINELVDLVNQDPRRGIGHEKVLTRLEVDEQARRLMEKAGYDEGTVLADGEVFFLRSTGNLSTGGTAIDMTDVCHPDNREMAIRAAATLGLDICGVDFLTPDISRSYKEVGGGICECNAGPGFRMHVAPSEGEPRDVAGKVIDMLFPPGRSSRIPIAAITGTNGKTTTTRMLAHIHKMVGETVGMTTSDGVYIDGARTVEGDMTGPVSAQMVLRDPAVSVAILETARGGLVKRGMGYSKPNVSCCLNVSEDHLGMNGINTLDDLAQIKRIPIEAASDTVVLNADDVHCLQMAAYSRADSICYVTMNSNNQLVKMHIRAGGMAAVLEDGINGQLITLYNNGTHIPLLWTHLIPATVEGKALHNVQNAMFAAAMAYAMDVSLDNIRQGLRTFDTSFFQAPGRMNFFERNGYKIILDYGHNPAAVEAMCDFVDRLSDASSFRNKGQKRCVLSAPGDRRDEDIVAMAQRASQSFDSFIVREDDRNRGRERGDVATLIHQALVESGVPDSKIEIILSEVDAVEHSLKQCQSGDILLVFADNVTRSWKQIIYYHEEEGAALDSPPAVFDAIVQKDVGITELDGYALSQDPRGVFFVPEAAD